jgi:hypothetical protein
MQNGRKGLKRHYFVGTRCQYAYKRARLRPQRHNRHDILGVDGPAVRHADDIARKPGGSHGNPCRPVSVQSRSPAYLNQCLDQPTPLVRNP